MKSPILRVRLTELFADRNITQRFVCYDQTFCVSLPHNVLILRGMIEHGSETQYHSLRLLLTAIRACDRPITAIEVNTQYFLLSQTSSYYV
jgi:hypothetical protein